MVLRNHLLVTGMAVILLLLSGCASYKDIMYFQDIDRSNHKNLTDVYEAVIRKDDRLTIIVSGPDKTVTAPYNLTLGEMGANGMSSSSNPETVTLSYLVDSNGDITFPILGKIHVEGMTRNQLVDYLTSEISKDVKDPIVYVTIKNYKITILGEVKAPGTYVIDSEKINILQALGKAGDLTLNAQRNGIVLLREEDGVEKHYKIDLRSSDLMEKPYFYLQQNDVLIVTASPTRVASATIPTGIWTAALSSITTLIAVISLIYK